MTTNQYCVNVHKLKPPQLNDGIGYEECVYVNDKDLSDTKTIIGA